MNLGRALATVEQTRSAEILSRVNRGLIRLTSRISTAAVNSRLPLYRPVAILSQTQIVAETRVRGVPLKLLISNHGDYGAFKGWSTDEPETLDLIDSMEDGSVFLDVGANIGRFTLYAAARLRGRGSVVSLEPDARLCHRLARNVMVNELDDAVTVLLLAASSADGHTEMVLDGRTQIGRVRESAAPFERTFTYTVEATTIDSLVARGIVPPPTHAKVDVDGHELAVVRGALETLASERMKAVLVEVDTDENAEIVDLLEARGYRAEVAREFPGSTAVNYVFRK